MPKAGMRRMLIVFFIFAPVLILGSFSARAGRDLKAGEAIVWYLGHCGYALKTQNHLLIFDYIELEEQASERGLARGFVDAGEIKDLDVCVFVSHSHVDHYDEVILDWEDEIKKIRYFFGWNAREGPRYYSMEGPRAVKTFADLEVYTVNSHHSGVPEVAFLVKVDGLVIFHGGDYQGRMGRDAPSNALDDMRYLKTKAASVDLFFIGAWTGDPYLDVIRSLDLKVIFPMHWRKKEQNYKQFAEDLRKLGISYPVICPEKRGDEFLFMDGAVQDEDAAKLAGRMDAT
jgi:L-ascorbate metabolism protein UlaG (beta-lactamase superfamily)